MRSKFSIADLTPIFRMISWRGLAPNGLLAGLLGLSLTSSLVAEVSDPLIESGVPLAEMPTYQGEALRLFDQGYPPAPYIYYYVSMATMGQVRKWQEYEDHAGLEFFVLWSKIYFAFFSTDGSLKEIPPKFQTAEGLRFMRGGKNGAFQVQSAYDIVDVEKTNVGWKLTRWKAEDTMPAKTTGWRVALPGREVCESLEVEEVLFDPERMVRDVIFRLTKYGSKPEITEITRFRSEMTNKRGQSVMEKYVGSEMLPENLILRNTLQCVRLPNGRRYEQIRTIEKPDAEGNLVMESQKSEIWEVDLRGRKRQILRDRNLER